MPPPTVAVNLEPLRKASATSAIMHGRPGEMAEWLKAAVC